MGLKHRVGMFVVALVAAATLAACEIEVGNFGASIGGNAPSFTITMYQGQDARRRRNSYSRGGPG